MNKKDKIARFSGAAWFMFLPLAVALTLGVFSTMAFYYLLNSWTLDNLREAIAEDWVRAEGERGVEAATREFLLENIRARRMPPRLVPTTASHPQEHIIINAAADSKARQSAESLAKGIAERLVHQTTVSVSNLYPTFTVVRVRHWPDPTDDVDRAIVTIGYLPSPIAPAETSLPAPAAWLVPLRNDRASVRLLKSDEMPTFGQLAQANLACVEESGVLFYVYGKGTEPLDRGNWSPSVPQLDTAGDVQRIEHQWVKWHVERLRDRIRGAQDPQTGERLREGLRNSPLSLYASADDITLTAVDGQETVRIVASRTGSFGSSAADRTPDFYVEFHTSNTAPDGLRWSSMYFAKAVVDACEAAVPDAISNRPRTAVFGLFFAGLKLDESAKSSQGVAFLTVPSVPSFEQFRRAFAGELHKAGFDIEVSPPARRGARDTTAADQEAAEQRSNLRLVEVYRLTVSLGSLILFRWFNGPVQWVTLWVFWTTMFLLIWFALIAIREAFDWPLWKSWHPTVRSTAKIWAGSNRLATQKVRERYRKDLLDKAAEDIDRADAKFKWLMWFFPNLGLLGTLFGLSAALGGSDRILAAERQVDMIMATQYVNGSMSVAFDTTIVGVLAMAAFLTARFFVQWLERWSQGVVSKELVNDLSGSDQRQTDTVSFTDPGAHK